MRRIDREICLTVAASFLILIGSPVMAPASAISESHAVTGSELDDALNARAGEEAAARETVLKVLDLPEVRTVAAQAGLDLQRAAAAVSLLSGEALRRVADQSRQVNRALAGGSDTIVISTTTLIIILLVVILLVVAD
jgi:hypothetical protein